MRKITEILILLNVLVFVYMSFGGLSDSYVISNLAFSGENLAEGKWWVLFTSLFIHGSLLHIALNSLALFFFGNALEPRVSNLRYILIYFLGGIAGFGVSYFFYSPSTPIIGASGSIFAIMGAAMLLHPFELVSFPFIVPLPVAFVGVIYSIANIVSFFSSSESNIAYIAHVAGLVVGVAIGLQQEGGKRGLLIVIATFLLVMLAPFLIQKILPPDYTLLLGKAIYDFSP